MILFAGFMVLTTACIVGGGLALTVLREADQDDADFDDVYCPYCDGTDLDDWGEPGWWSCRPCQMLFEVKEPPR